MEEKQAQAIEKDVRIQALITNGMTFDAAQKGIVRFNFTIPDQLSDGDGNWHVGAMATLTDVIGIAAAHSYAGPVKGSVDFSISYYSKAKIHEEVELEAKVVGDNRRLISVVIHVRRKGNGELIALGKIWAAATSRSDGSVSRL